MKSNLTTHVLIAGLDHLVHAELVGLLHHAHQEGLQDTKCWFLTSLELFFTLFNKFIQIQIFCNSLICYICHNYSECILIFWNFQRINFTDAKLSVKRYGRMEISCNGENWAENRGRGFPGFIHFNSSKWGLLSFNNIRWAFNFENW